MEGDGQGTRRGIGKIEGQGTEGSRRRSTGSAAGRRMWTRGRQGHGAEEQTEKKRSPKLFQGRCCQEIMMVSLPGFRGLLPEPGNDYWK